MSIDWKTRRTGWGRRGPVPPGNDAWLSFLQQLQECLGENATVVEAIQFLQRQTVHKQVEVPHNDGGSDE